MPPTFVAVQPMVVNLRIRKNDRCGTPYYKNPHFSVAQTPYRTYHSYHLSKKIMLQRATSWNSVSRFLARTCRRPVPTLCIPYVPKISEAIRRTLNPEGIRVAFVSTNTLGKSLTHAKDSIPKYKAGQLRSNNQFRTFAPQTF